MNKVVKFKHTSGTFKMIPGIPVDKCMPRLRQENVQEPSSPKGKEPRLVQVDRPEEIVLLDEQYDGLTEEEQSLPQEMQDELKKQHVADTFERINTNKKVMTALRSLEAQGEIEIISIDEMTPQQVVLTNSPIISLSEIAIADHNARGIPIPEKYLQNSVAAEKARAATKAAKK